MSTKSSSFLTDRKYWDKMLQARSWGGVSRYIFTSWALPSCPHQLALLVEISYRKDKWLFDSLLREWGEGEKGLDSQGVLWAPILFSISPCEQGASNLGTHWSPGSFEEVKPAAWWTRCWGGMDGTHPARAGGGGEDSCTRVPGSCSGLAFPGHSFPACSVPVPCHTGQAHDWVAVISGPWSKPSGNC